MNVWPNRSDHFAETSPTRNLNRVSKKKSGNIFLFPIYRGTVLIWRGMPQYTKWQDIFCSDDYYFFKQVYSIFWHDTIWAFLYLNILGVTLEWLNLNLLIDLLINWLINNFLIDYSLFYITCRAWGDVLTTIALISMGTFIRRTHTTTGQQQQTHLVLYYK